MKTNRHIVLLVLIMLPVYFFGQQYNTEEEITLTQKQWKALQNGEMAYQKWIDETLKPGIETKQDTLIFSEEAKRLIKDIEYRKKVYKEQYTFVDVQESLTNMELQKAFWQMIALYPKHKKEVLQYLLLYKKVIDTDKILLSSFYTYAFFDPKITKIENGTPTIYRPDIFEDKFRITKEIITYIQYFDNEEKKKNAK